MFKTTFLLGLLVATAGAGLAQDASARERSRAVSRTAQGGSVSASHTGALSSGQRQRNWQADGAGTASASRSRSMSGVNGGSASRSGDAYRHADGSAGRSYSATVTTANGGTASRQGDVTRNADGGVSAERSTTATGQNGNRYSGATTISDGSLVHTGSCTDAAGQTISCRP
jgi:hypothetical protein